MIEFFKAGGPPMLVVLGCAIAALVGAVRFALRPDPRRVASIISMSIAVLGATFLGVFADIAMVGRNVPRMENIDGLTLAKISLMGLAESMSPLILGFGVLTAVALLVAIGYRRLVPRLPAV